MRPLTACCCFLLAACTAGPAPEATGSGQPGPTGPVRSHPVRSDPVRIDYGDHPAHFGVLRVPEGDGPFPVAVLIHGGCWQSSIATYEYFEPLAEALVGRGLATWNIEFRSIDEEGGGWPGTFRDVMTAIAALEVMADDGGRSALDLGRVVLVGHSSGGHLALWAAGADPADLGVASTFRPAATVPIAPITDLVDPPAATIEACGATTIGRLASGIDPARISPLQMLPLGTPQRLVNGVRDRIIPVEAVRRYRAAAMAAGDDATLLEVPAVGHFEVITPGSGSWAPVEELVVEAAREAAMEAGREPAGRRSAGK